MPIDTAFVFAAGFGTRMGALTKSTPKPMVGFGDGVLIDHSLKLLRGAGISRIFVNTHYLAEQIARHVRDAQDITCIYEPDILETGGGLKNALHQLDRAEVLTINSDAIFSGDNPVTALLRDWAPEKMDALLSVVARDADSARTGDFHRDKAGRLWRRGDDPLADFVYSGAQVMKTKTLADFPSGKFSLNDVWDQIIGNHRLFGQVYQGDWYDVGTPDGLAVAQKAVFK